MKETKKTNRAEPILVEQITTPVTMGVTILLIAVFVALPLMLFFPKTIFVALFIWLISCIIKNNKKQKIK